MITFNHMLILILVITCTLAYNHSYVVLLAVFKDFCFLLCYLFLDDDDEPKLLFIFEFEDKDGKRYKQYVIEVCGFSLIIVQKRLKPCCAMSTSTAFMSTDIYTRFVHIKLDRHPIFDVNVGLVIT